MKISDRCELQHFDWAKKEVADFLKSKGVGWIQSKMIKVDIGNKSQPLIAYNGMLLISFFLHLSLALFPPSNEFSHANKA